jgi:hypothetical protein
MDLCQIKHFLNIVVKKIHSQNFNSKYIFRKFFFFVILNTKYIFIFLIFNYLQYSNENFNYFRKFQKAYFHKN